MGENTSRGMLTVLRADMGLVRKKRSRVKK